MLTAVNISENTNRKSATLINKPATDIDQCGGDAKDTKKTAINTSLAYLIAARVMPMACSYVLKLVWIIPICLVLRGRSTSYSIQHLTERFTVGGTASLQYQANLAKTIIVRTVSANYLRLPIIGGACITGEPSYIVKAPSTDVLAFAADDLGCGR